MGFLAYVIFTIATAIQKQQGNNSVLPFNQQRAINFGTKFLNSASVIMVLIFTLIFSKYGR